MLKGVDNLRSGVAKISLMTLIEMSQTYTRLLEVELESIMNKLLKKSMDTSVFIAEEVKRALQ